jgi:hypothetical protein
MEARITQFGAAPHTARSNAQSENSLAVSKYSVRGPDIRTVALQNTVCVSDTGGPYLLTTRTTHRVQAGHTD